MSVCVCKHIRVLFLQILSLEKLMIYMILKLTTFKSAVVVTDTRFDKDILDHHTMSPHVATLKDTFSNVYLAEYLT